MSWNVMVCGSLRPAPLQKTLVPQVPPVGEVVTKTHVRKWPGTRENSHSEMVGNLSPEPPRGPPPCGLCRSWLALVECLDAQECSGAGGTAGHVRLLSNVEALELAGLVSCRLRARGC
jgi:hypothetical protein